VYVAARMSLSSAATARSDLPLVDHLRAVPDLLDQFLLLDEVVRHQRLQRQILFSSNNSVAVSYP